MDDTADAATVLASAPVQQWFADWLKRLNKDASGNASRLEWIALQEEPPSADRGEITDKGSLNQRSVLTHRAERVAACYGGMAPLLIRA